MATLGFFLSRPARRIFAAVSRMWIDSYTERTPRSARRSPFLTVVTVTMRHYLIGVLVVFAANDAAAQSTPAGRIIAAESAAVRALHLTKGDVASLHAATAALADSAKAAYLRTLQAFLDDTGAPQFSQTFAPVGRPVVVNDTNGIVRVRIPGELTQTTGASRTTYRERVDVEFGGTPPRILRMSQTTCTREQARTYCM